MIAAVTLGVALWAHATGRPWQSMAFFALGTTQLAAALGSRARPGTWANPMLLVAVAAALALQFAGVYLPFLRELLDTKPLTGLDLLVVFLASTLGYAAIRLDRILFRRKRTAAPPGAASEDGQDTRQHPGTAQLGRYTQIIPVGDQDDGGTGGGPGPSEPGCTSPSPAARARPAPGSGSSPPGRTRSYGGSARSQHHPGGTP